MTGTVIVVGTVEVMVFVIVSVVVTGTVTVTGTEVVRVLVTVVVYVVVVVKVEYTVTVVVLGLKRFSRQILFNKKCNKCNLLRIIGAGDRKDGGCQENSRSRRRNTGKHRMSLT